jgi:tetratricopeptide (TPR) repeat protein
MKILFVTLMCAAAALAGTPAETAIQKAQNEIAKNPRAANGYNDLAMSLARRARETSDVEFYTKAEEALQNSFRAAPDNYEGLKVKAWLLLGRHDFAGAREVAMKLNKAKPDDVTVYGYLADANAELGNYQEAVDAAQWMLNIRPGNVPGLTRAAYLRELHGDYDGALDLMQQAYDSTPSAELEDRAWLLTQCAHLNLMAGNLSEAERFANGALGLFPGYHYALGTLGQVRMEQKRYEEAVELFRKRYEGAAHAENLYSLAEALRAAGHAEEAATAFADFEQQALKESTGTDNANHELVAYYLDYAHEPEKALRIVGEELARRHDAYTLEGHARALAACGKTDEAAMEMKRALAFGLRDPRVLEHARTITE